MKAILEFDFDKEDSDDRSHFEDAVNGTKWKMFAWQFDQWLRSQTKYASDATPEEYVKALYEARDRFHDMLREDNLSLD
jgi:hypothetical protein